MEVAKDILDAIMSGHVEGMPGEDAEMAAEEEAQEEAPRGGHRCRPHASQPYIRLLAEPDSLRCCSLRCDAQPGCSRSAADACVFVVVR